MKSLRQLIAEGEEKEWGIESNLDRDRLMFVSHEGVSLVNSATRKIQSVVELAQSYTALPLSERHKSRTFTRYEVLGEGGEGTIYRIPVKKEIEVALKIYDYQGCGLDYFEVLIKARQEDRFDTLTPFLATEDFILTDILPQLPEYEEFVRQHPELESEVYTALLDVQTASKIKDAGLDVPPWFEDDYEFTPDDYEDLDKAIEHEFSSDTGSNPFVKHVYISRFNPSAKDLNDRYRFFIIDMM